MGLLESRKRQTYIIIIYNTKTAEIYCEPHTIDFQSCTVLESK